MTESLSTNELNLWLITDFFIAFKWNTFSLTVACQVWISVLILCGSKTDWCKLTFLLYFLLNCDNVLGIQVSRRSGFPDSLICSLYLQICVWFSHFFWQPFCKYLGEMGKVDFYSYITLQLQSWVYKFKNQNILLAFFVQCFLQYISSCDFFFIILKKWWCLMGEKLISRLVG